MILGIALLNNITIMDVVLNYLFLLYAATGVPGIVGNTVYNIYSVESIV